MAEQKPEGWVDFKAIKEAVTVSQVFEHYGIDLKEYAGKADERKLPCPLCDSKSRSLAVNVAKQTFYCFACKARGNVLDFVAKREGCTVKDAASKLAAWFMLSGDAAKQLQEGTAGQSNALTLLAEIKQRVEQLEQLLQQKA